MEYGTIVSPRVIPFAEFEKSKDDLPNYRTIENEEVDFSKHFAVIAHLFSTERNLAELDGMFSGFAQVRSD